MHETAQNPFRNIYVSVKGNFAEKFDRILASPSASRLFPHNCQVSIDLRSFLNSATAMASSARSRPSETPNRQRTGPTPLPTYQPPQHPLNENAIRAITDLPRNHRLDSLKNRLNVATNHLAGAAVDINDRLLTQITVYEKSRDRREKLGSQEDDNNEEEERAMNEKRQQTNELTGRLELGVRKIIDAKVQVQGVEKALKELETNVANNRGAIAPTQSTLGASQFRSNRRRRGADADSDEDEDDVFDDNTQENGSAVDFVKRKIEEQNSAYQNETMAFR